MRISNIRSIAHGTTCFVAVLAGLALVPMTHAQAPPPMPSTNASLLTAITRHGAQAVRAVTRLRIEGQSASPRGAMRVVISAELNGNIRLDYGNPVTRSLLNTPTGSSEILNGRSLRKPPHVGVFAQLDLLSIFGLMRLETGNVTWTDLGPSTVAGRAAVGRRADTGQTTVQYRRTLRDQTDMRFDALTGLVSSITRTHYAENSVDLAMPVTFIFLDYRSVTNLTLPYRIERYLNATVMEVITVTRVELNPTFSPSIFVR